MEQAGKIEKMGEIEKMGQWGNRENIEMAKIGKCGGELEVGCS